jgi:hypothetical protein
VTDTLLPNCPATTTLDAGALDCPICGYPLNVSQPDDEVPCELLAICQDCGAWFLHGERYPDGPELLRWSAGKVRRGGNPMRSLAH